jgi:hypothetical protein
VDAAGDGWLAGWRLPGAAMMAAQPIRHGPAPGEACYDANGATHDANGATYDANGAT